jgi:hypothetical protein
MLFRKFSLLATGITGFLFSIHAQAASCSGLSGSYALVHAIKGACPAQISIQLDDKFVHVRDQSQRNVKFDFGIQRLNTTYSENRFGTRVNGAPGGGGRIYTYKATECEVSGSYRYIKGPDDLSLFGGSSQYVNSVSLDAKDRLHVKQQNFDTSECQYQKQK